MLGFGVSFYMFQTRKSYKKIRKIILKYDCKSGRKSLAQLKIYNDIKVA